MWEILTCLLILSSIATMPVNAADEPTVIPLWSGVAPGSEGYDQEEVYDPRQGEGIGWITGVSMPTLTLYPPTSADRSGTGVVICPGGGYGGLAIDHEGHALAKWFAERGVVAAVLKYRHGGGKHQHPVPLNDAQRALRLMRSHADEWQLKPDRIGIAGFSAGGHLASSAGTHFDEGRSEAEDPIDRVSCRANFLVLVYPVISMDEAITHDGSRKNLLGENPSDELIHHLSSERQVTADTGPTFLVHAANDEVVPVENSLRFFEALRKHKVPAEMHIYETGGHGFGMHRGDKPADHWPELLEGWFVGRGLISSR